MLEGALSDASKKMLDSGEGDKYWTQVAVVRCLIDLYDDSNDFNHDYEKQLVDGGKQPEVTQLVAELQRIRLQMRSRLLRQYPGLVKAGVDRFGWPDDASD